MWRSWRITNKNSTGTSPALQPGTSWTSPGDRSQRRNCVEVLLPTVPTSISSSSMGCPGPNCPALRDGEDDLDLT
eukprot:11565589-Prorocentrum_lima.AAC.1